MPTDLPRVVLDHVERWPAAHVGIVVVGPEGLLAQHGDVDRRFALASVTKALVSSAVLMAVEEGALTLDDPAGPEGSTVRHLLAHASGLTPDGRSPMVAPGKRRIYSNSGFEILGETFATSTGIELGQYLRDGVLSPLEMTSTSVPGSVAHSAVSTAGDLGRWVVALMQSVEEAPGTIWHRTTIEQLSEIQFHDLAGVLPGYGPQSPNPWGLGFEIRGDKSPHWTGRHNSPRTFGHFGRSGTFVWIDPDVSLGLVALGDVDFGDWAIDLWPALADAVLSSFGGV